MGKHRSLGRKVCLECSGCVQYGKDCEGWPHPCWEYEPREDPQKPAAEVVRADRPAEGGEG